MREHEALAVYEPQNAHGYLWRPTCLCGWKYGWRMASEEAALDIAQGNHVDNVGARVVEGTYSTWVSANGTRGTSWSPR